MNQRILGIAALVAISVFFLTRGCGGRPDDPTSGAGAQGEVASLPRSESVVRAVEEKAGLKRIPFSGRRVKIAVTPKGWCNYGDLDAIALDANRASPAPLLLTLEPLPGSLGVSQSKEVTLADLEKGFTHDFVVESGSGHQLGLYLCLDQGRTGRCGGKRIQPINEIFADYAVAPERLRGTRPPDRVYYFQFLHFGRGDLITPSKPVFTEVENNELQIWAAMSAPSVDKIAENHRGLAAAQGNIAQLQSMALQSGSGSADLAMVLPHFDKSRCNDTVGEDPRGTPEDAQ